MKKHTKKERGNFVDLFYELMGRMGTDVKGTSLLYHFWPKGTLFRVPFGQKGTSLSEAEVAGF